MRRRANHDKLPLLQTVGSNESQRRCKRLQRQGRSRRFVQVSNLSENASVVHETIEGQWELASAS